MNQIYLTNTLSDFQAPATLPGPFELAISQDGKAAQNVKARERILAVVGNPPYFGASYNVYDSVDDYRVPGERARNWLQDDYIKFIRWAEWKVTEAAAGYQAGIVGFITNHAYLTGVIHRGMRQHLMEHFSHVYILNLHGNSRIREILPPGIQRDENVFDIQQGVAIALFVRELRHEGVGDVFYAELWGDRKSKYDFLDAHDVTDTSWTRISPNAPSYYFIERSESGFADEFRAWPSLTQLMPIYSQAIVSARDGFATAFEERDLVDRLTRFGTATAPDDQVGEEFGVHDTREFAVSRARQLLASGPRPSRIVPLAYRPFDIRWIYYSGDVLEWPREGVLGHMLVDGNLALAAFRHTRRQTLSRAFAARQVVDTRLLSSESNCFAFPLYTHFNPDDGPQLALVAIAGLGAHPNFNNGVIDNLQARYGGTVSPEDVFSYVYGILNSPGYQLEFETLLHGDFPRIPFVEDADAFRQMGRRGARLLELHLLEAGDLQGLGDLTVGFPIAGNDKVERTFPSFEAADGRVYINGLQYFDGITVEAWDYWVGSYQPLERWLENRRGRVLNAGEPRHYQTMATAIKKVLEELADVELAWQTVLSGSHFDPTS